MGVDITLKVGHRFILVDAAMLHTLIARGVAGTYRKVANQIEVGSSMDGLITAVLADEGRRVMKWLEDSD